MRIITILLLCLCTNQINAQAPAFLDSSHLPRPGDKHYVYSIIKGEFYDANDTGENVTWDFSDYVIGNKGDSFDFALPAERNINCEHPQANLITGIPDDYICYLKNANGLYKTYIKDSLNGPNIPTFYYYYPRPEILFPANLSFRQVLNDTSTFYKIVNPTEIDSFRKGIRFIEVKYDGYGTLLVANQTFDSAIRVVFTRYERDSAYFNNKYNIGIDIYKEYQWFIPSSRVWVLNIMTRYVLDSTGTDTLGKNFKTFFAGANINTGLGQSMEFLQGFNAWFSGNEILL